MEPLAQAVESVSGVKYISPKERLAMPLKHSTSKAAQSSNIRAEVRAGKPVKQAVAISYAVKRAAAQKKKK